MKIISMHLCMNGFLEFIMVITTNLCYLANHVVSFFSPGLHHWSTNHYSDHETQAKKDLEKPHHLHGLLLLLSLSGFVLLSFLAPVLIL